MELFLISSILSLVSNGLTLVYILKSFDISLHVFALLFIDATLSTIFSGFLVVFDFLVVSNISNRGFVYCSASFILLYLPAHSGAILTFLISLVRYILARKSAKNIQPPNGKVLKWSVGAFSFLFSFISVYIFVNEIMDVPYAIMVEACNWRDREPRFINKPRFFVLQIPNYYNIASIVIDVLMLTFLKKTLYPASSVNLIQLRSNQNENENQNELNGSTWNNSLDKTFFSFYFYKN